MARGPHQIAYYREPRPTTPRDAFYEEMQSFTGEVFEGDEAWYDSLTAFVVLPPTRHEGTFLKGLLLTNGADILCERLPRLAELFEIVAYSMWAGYPWSRRAQGLATLYPNAEREAWFRGRYPERAAQTLIPMLDSDWVNEAAFVPQRLPKDIDILCVSRLDPCKNLFMVAEALRVLRRKHPERRLQATLACGTEVDVNWSGRSEQERDSLRQMGDALGHVPDYLHIVGKHDYFHMHELYSRAKVYVLGSLLEGKNRGVLEAMACNTPTVHFADYNRIVRAGAPVTPPAAGLAAPDFDAESLADTLWAAVQDHGDFRARRALLGFSGRAHTFVQLVDALPYFAAHLPDFVAGAHLHSPWLDCAIAAEYQQNLSYFVYGHNPFLTHRLGLLPCLETLQFYCDRLA